MEKYYTDEQNIQIVLALLKAHKIRKIVASPGTTNMTLVASMQQDSYFEMYSSVDERSAAYMACGLAAESGEPVVLSCTGATASRNYMPGLTEAYYRKLPILAITSTQDTSKIGHNIAQVIDRRVLPNDIAKLSVDIPTIRDDDDVWNCEIKVNKALLELKHHGGGPIHINLATVYSRNYTTKELPQVRVIDRICIGDEFPVLPVGRVGVFVGSHIKWNEEETDVLDRFCAIYDAVVFCDHTSNYKGKYRMLHSLVTGQEQLDTELTNLELLIHIGEVSGNCYLGKFNGKSVWRIGQDGEICDTFRKLRYVFEMSEKTFFEYYIKGGKTISDSCLQNWKSLYRDIYESIPELPFSNVWIASKMAYRLPDDSVIHFGIYNSLRSWDFFELPHSVLSFSNVGGFGIDGGMSSLVGASFHNKSRIYFGVLGDLAFFYDMNVLGNRHVGNNLRILLVNNGKGTEFRQYFHPGSAFGEDADQFISAGGHYGNKSRTLVKHYAEDLGFEYLSASDKQEFEQVYERFLTPEITSKPILFEIFTNNEDESDAVREIRNIEKNVKGRARKIASQVLSNKAKDSLKKILGR